MKVGLLAGATLLSLSALCGQAGATPGESERSHPRAHSTGDDGIYARLDANFALRFEAGAELQDGDARGALRASAHYLWTAGVYARYSDSLGRRTPQGLRVASLGVDLRPLFLPRFALDLEQGPALLDLCLDSLSLTAGAYFAKPMDASFGHLRGFETGLGLGVPLLGRTRGPWLDLRAERRFADHAESAWLFSLSVGLETLVWSTDPGPV